MLGGQQVIVERRADISDVERAGRRRCEAGDDGHAGDLGGRPVQCHLPISDRQMGSCRSYVASGTVCPVAQRSSQSRMRRIPVGSGASLRRRAESIRLAAMICPYQLGLDPRCRPSRLGPIAAAHGSVPRVD